MNLKYHLINSVLRRLLLCQYSMRMISPLIAINMQSTGIHQQVGQMMGLQEPPTMVIWLVFIHLRMLDKESSSIMHFVMLSVTVVQIISRMVTIS
ncbi:hypothetical protein SE18_25635 [Herpetosiphon geysericola]|uniref:Uncharacterized protein n=1 Tax=Herpetosiphon geysericola TaxID=70996 RepID=A0A0P6Y4I8_9CHLR|nr:hypothetical protein SE18_25635 [Herpetosiphon geysericola]